MKILLKEKNLKLLEISVFIAFVLTAVISFVHSTEKNCGEIKENVLRLHIIANSDSGEDQNLKLKVRDAVLAASGDIFASADSAQTAALKAENASEYLTETAQKVINENGFDYDASVSIGKCRFPTREYGEVTLPAGEYNAVRIILGEGKGHNWWCVMFPPLCLPATEENCAEMEDVLSPDALAFVKSGKKYNVKFKIIEWYENIKEKVREKTND